MLVAALKQTLKTAWRTNLHATAYYNLSKNAGATRIQRKAIVGDAVGEILQGPNTRRNARGWQAGVTGGGRAAGLGIPVQHLFSVVYLRMLVIPSRARGIKYEPS